MTNTNTNAATKAQTLVLDAMRRAGWFSAEGCTVVDKDGNAVKA